MSELLALALKSKASDLHLSTGLPPIVRVDGQLQRLNLPFLTEDNLSKVIRGILNEKLQRQFEDQKEIDFAFHLDNNCRLRVNLFTQARGLSAVFRIIPGKIPTIDELNLPPIFKEIASWSKGLVLVTGSAGSGKSTTVATLIDYINSHYQKHILTIEDPIEFIYQSNKSLIQQREVHRDSHSFNAALRSALRQDPNVILIGELRDYETISLALTAAETGHLVFATLHTNSAAKTINRIIDVFPGNEKNKIRMILSDSLQAVIAQSLLPKIDGGRVAAFEVMISNPAIRNLIREDKIGQIYSAIQTGQKTGMQTLDQSLLKLLSKQVITDETASESVRG